MKNLKKQFFFFFILLGLGLGFLLWKVNQQISIQEEKLWHQQAEKVFNQMQSSISNRLEQEDKRSGRDYLSEVPSFRKDLENGDILGYFNLQLDRRLYYPTKDKTNESVRAIVDSADFELKPVSKPVALPLDYPNTTVSMDAFSQGVPPAAPLLQDKKEQVLPESREGFVGDVAGPEESSAKSMYPNPVQQRVQELEKNSMSLKFGSMKSAPKKKDDASAQAIQPQVEPKPLGAVMPGSKKKNKDVVDPFQAKIVKNEYVVFYRNFRWYDSDSILQEAKQGFVLHLPSYFKKLMDESFANSEFVDFAVANLQVGNRVLATYGFIEPPKNVFYQASLGYPLSLLQWKILSDQWPPLSERYWIHFFSILFGILTVTGLVLIYRTTNLQVLLSQKKNDFVSAVTHELKTPLTAIRMYSEILEEGWQVDEEKKRQYYNLIQQESGRLSRLIENVLQLARLEKRALKVHTVSVSPSLFFQELTTELKGLVEKKGFVLEAKFEENLPSIVCDKELLKQVFWIFVDNSLKFAANAENKKFHLEAFVKDSKLVMTWLDHGPGVPESEKDKIFESFYRVESEETRKTQGTGLGLALARQFVEEMGGTIKADLPKENGLMLSIYFQSRTA